MAAFTKLSNGSWALKSMTALVVGSTVQVLKADGSTANLVVGNLIKTSGGISMYEFTRSPTHPASTGAYRPRRCTECRAEATRYNPIYKSGECRNCYQERKEEQDMGH